MEFAYDLLAEYVPQKNDLYIRMGGVGGAGGPEAASSQAVEEATLSQMVFSFGMQALLGTNVRMKVRLRQSPPPLPVDSGFMCLGTLSRKPGAFPSGSSTLIASWGSACPRSPNFWTPSARILKRYDASFLPHLRTYDRSMWSSFRPFAVAVKCKSIAVRLAAEVSKYGGSQWDCCIAVYRHQGKEGTAPPIPVCFAHSSHPLQRLVPLEAENYDDGRGPSPGLEPSLVAQGLSGRLPRLAYLLASFMPKSIQYGGQYKPYLLVCEPLVSTCIKCCVT